MKNNEIIEKIAKIAKSTIRGKLKYMLSIFAMCGLISLVAFSSETKAETLVEKETTVVVEKETNIPTESTKPNETTGPNETKKPEETAKASIIKKSSLSPAKSKVILLDPGHCKSHKGAKANGIKEEDVNLDIGKACRNYLNKYSDVTVYITRTNNKCLKRLKLGDCLTARNHLAKRLSADSLVSFHINWDPDKKRSGAMILAAYNSGYNKNVSKTTQALGSSIMSNLQELGIKSEGFWFRTLDNVKYKNGAKADYYSIVREGVLNRIPSLIIEHGYVSNKSDCNNYFKTAEQRKSLGVADAKGIINYYKLSAKNIEGDFQTISGKTYFVDKEGNKIAGWVKKDGKWYHFNNKTAVMNKGFFKEAGNKFYLNPKTGEMTSGWFTISGKSYLAKGNGVVVTNQIYTDGVKSYFFKKSGKRKNGWVTYKNAKYYFSKTKGMLKGKQKIKGKRYTFSKKTGKLRKKK